MSNMPPLIRLEVGEMKYSVMHYLHEHHLEVESQVEKQIEQAIASYDFEEEVTRAVHKAIGESIRNYFSLGQGADIIYEAVADTLTKVFQNPHDAEKEG